MTVSYFASLQSEWLKKKRSLTLPLEFPHKFFAGRLVLELPKMVFHAFKDQGIDGKLHAFANR